jgi:hypothetical protein
MINQIFLNQHLSDFKKDHFKRFSIMMKSMYVTPVDQDYHSKVKKTAFLSRKSLRGYLEK